MYVIYLAFVLQEAKETNSWPLLYILHIEQYSLDFWTGILYFHVLGYTVKLDDTAFAW